ncbi:hypothetical protein A6A08_11560 [Nocardiopsis sp. TSRI0078]|nr:hypothetical protein A6A08_11560 [Nocardiopsis sp. TSRI0078]
MPRSLRFLRVMFSLWGTISALAALLYVFLLLSLYVYTPPNFEEWLSAKGFFVAELWVMPFVHGLRAVFYAVGAVRLGRGGRTGHRWALVAVYVEAGAVVSGTLLSVLVLGVVSVLDLIAVLLVTEVSLVFPGLLLLLLPLSLHSSREWFRATGG